MLTADDILAGFDEHRFSLYYQPKYSTLQAGFAGSEALARWFGPDGIVHGPDEFVSVAEKAGLQAKLTQHIVSLLFDDIGVLRETNFCPVSFNTCACDFEDGRLVTQIFEALARTGVPAGLIEVEITENQALTSGPHVRENLERLRQAGLGLAMDDYGIGYSSADTLSRWPFSAIKVDQGLIGRMLESEKSASIVRGAIRMAHELDIDLVAEGVETEAQCQFLIDSGCVMMQGYLVSRPLALADLLRFGTFMGCDASMAVGLLHMALMDHLQWRHRMVSYALRCANLPASSEGRLAIDYPVLDSSACLIGRWFRQQGMILESMPHFQASDEAHRRLHQVGAEIVEQIQGGATPDLIQPSIERLHQTSVSLLDSMMRLENGGLASVYSRRSRSAPLEQDPPTL